MTNLTLCLTPLAAIMAVHCNSDIRFFLHTFIFVNNTSISPALNPSDLSPVKGGNSSGDWLRGGGGSNDTGPVFRNGDLQQVLECLQMYLLPVLVCVGVGGSALGVAVLLATFLRFKFFTHFLVCLNVSSAAFLLVVFLSWLADNGVHVYSLPGLCQVNVFSSHFFPFLTVWHSVLGAYLVLYDWLRPGKRVWLHSPTAAKTTVVGLSVLGFTMYSYKTWTHYAVTHRGSRVCTVIPENQLALEILNVLDVLLLLVLPAILHAVFVLLVLLARLHPRCCRRLTFLPCLSCLRCSPLPAKAPDRVLYVTPGDVTAELTLSAKRCSGKWRRCREVHRLVLSQSFLFLLLVSPRAVSTLIVIVHRWLLRLSQSTDDILLLHIFQFSFYLYFTLLPYCPALTSTKFRLHCCALFSTSSPRRTHTTPRDRPQGEQTAITG